MEFDIISGEIVVKSCYECPFNFERTSCFCDISETSSAAMQQAESKDIIPLSCPLNKKKIIVRAEAKS